MVKAGSKMVRALAMGAVQMYGKVPSTGLTPIESTPSISAGLPHFTTHHMRCWGRDIFICLPGLFLSTGLFEIAKAHILNFASCVKHGLIPNLLDAGRRPRYNARDAAWWFLHAIKRYCEYNESTSILDETIKRRFPSDEFVDYEDSKAYSTKSTIREVMFEILKRHACGIRFVEWNAGPNLDHAMTAEGFNIEIKFDPNTGLIFGGNRMNCGTWMDKMGDSGKAGTRGFPATPRDGAAVEIIGLLKAVVFWVSKLAKNNLFPSVVTLQDGKSYSFDQWNSALQTSFEKCFYIPKESSMDSNYMIDSKIVNVRGIYKDTYKSSLHYTDYQLRPNFVVAMALVSLLILFFKFLGS
jgi:glycogen debranching enzyme